MIVSYGTAAAGGSQQHTGTQLRVAGYGPGAANLVGLIDQTDLHFIIKNALAETADVAVVRGLTPVVRRPPRVGRDRDQPAADGDLVGPVGGVDPVGGQGGRGHRAGAQVEGAQRRRGAEQHVVVVEQRARCRARNRRAGTADGRAWCAATAGRPSRGRTPTSGRPPAPASDPPGGPRRRLARRRHDVPGLVAVAVEGESAGPYLVRAVPLLDERPSGSRDRSRPRARPTPAGALPRPDRRAVAGSNEHEGRAVLARGHRLAGRRARTAAARPRAGCRRPGHRGSRPSPRRGCAPSPAGRRPCPLSRTTRSLLARARGEHGHALVVEDLGRERVGRVHDVAGRAAHTTAAPRCRRRAPPGRAPSFAGIVATR